MLMANNLTSIEVLMFVVNIIVFFSSYRMFHFFYRDNEKDAKLRTNVAIGLTGIFFVLQFLFLLTDLSLLSLSSNIIKTLKDITYTTGTFYGILLFQAIVHYIIKRNFGKTSKVDGKDIFIDTPTSRMWSLISIVISFFMLVYINIQIWSAASLMETTGIVGMTLGALALTNSVWFPDIYNGFILLKNSSLHIGDVVQFNDEEDIYLVHKTSFLQLALLNVLDNNRTFVPNNILKDAKIHNLSRLASSNGLRRTIIYKIGYPKQNINVKEREESIKRFIGAVRKMANSAYENLIKNSDVKLKEKAFEIGVKNTGDYAIEFVLSYHIDQIPKSFVVSNIRDYLIRTEYAINEEMLIQSYVYNIDLSTPTNIIMKKEE